MTVLGGATTIAPVRMASISLDLNVSVEGAHAMFTGKMLHKSEEYELGVCNQVTVRMHVVNCRFVQCLVVVGNTQSFCMFIMIMSIRSLMLRITAMLMMVANWGLLVI